MDASSDIVNLAKELISIPSISSDVPQLNKVIDFIASYCQKSGLSTQKLEYSGKPSLLISLSPNPCNPTVLLNGHADVVPAKPEQFHPGLVEGKLYGRGAEDMKGQLAVMIFSMVQLAKANPSAPVQLLVNTDEEIGGHNGAESYAKSLVSQPQFVLVGEGTGFKIENASKGVTWVKVRTKGKRAHGAYPWKGDNAIAKLVAELSIISQLYPRPADFVWETTCNFGQISGGEAANQIPDSAFAILDIRRIPTESTADIIAKFQSSRANADTEFEVLANEPAHYANPGHPIIEKLSQSITQVLGVSPETSQACGASDARHFSGVGIPAICFGPQGTGLHSDEEFIEIAELEKFSQVLNNFLSSFS